MEENYKKNYEYSHLSSNSIKRIKNPGKSYLSQILLNSNRNTKKEEISKSNNLNINEFPIIQNSKISSFMNNINDSNYSKNNISNSNSNQYHLKQLLFNSISFDNYQKAIMDSRILNNSKDVLPPIIPEEKKDNAKNIDSFINELNSSTGSTKNILQNNNSRKKKYSFCLKTLCEININKRYENSKIKEKKNVYDISKNKILREIILNEYIDEELNYEEQKILGDFKYYNKWIKTQLLQLKKEIPSEENVHRTFEKEYKNSKYNNPILTLNSLSISFNCKGKYHLFHIPFEYMPLFYYKNMSYLKLILASIIKFDNDFEDIIIDYDEIIYILSCSKQFEIKEEDDIENTDKRAHETRKDQISFTSLIKAQKLVKNMSSKRLNNGINDIMERLTPENGPVTPKEVFRKKNTLRVSSKRDTKVINNDNININALNNDNNDNNDKNKQENEKITKTKKIKKDLEEKNMYKCIYNKFLFKWNTPKYNYDITVKAPEAIFKVGETVLKVYIDIELIFYLLENNFDNWDFYISQYIFSYKECHKKMGKLISVKSMNDIFSKKTNVLPLLKSSLSTNNIKESTDVKDDKNTNINNNIDNNCNIENNLNMEKIHQISERSKKYEFIYTDENNVNYIKIFHSFFISARCKTFVQNKFCFDFNFFHMRILNKILRIQGLNYFFKKLICLDRQNSCLRFKYDELSTLANGNYRVLEKHDPNTKGSQSCLRLKERDKDVINICISFPTLETIKYNNTNYDNCFESDYDIVIFDGTPLDILDEICRNNFNEWPNILMRKKS